MQRITVTCANLGVTCDNNKDLVRYDVHKYEKLWYNAHLDKPLQYDAHKKESFVPITLNAMIDHAYAGVLECDSLL